ncbi:MAG: hypothetical protein DMG11_08025 [Acidobacteria bacterium]|nr:MAG: hypothetical protein DMG11_08025 [Acidobacteriota bacterium]
MKMPLFPAILNVSCGSDSDFFPVTRLIFPSTTGFHIVVNFGWFGQSGKIEPTLMTISAQQQSLL